MRECPHQPERERGYSLLELLVALVVFAEIAAIILLVFQTNSRVARVQTDLTTVQQSLRFAQIELSRQVRLAGRGGLAQSTPAKARPDQGAALEVLSNVTGSEREIAQGAADSPLALEGSDVIVVRGVFSTPLYQVANGTEGAPFFVLRDAADAPTTDPDEAVSGQVHLCATSQTGFPQPIEPLREAIDSEAPEALVLVSSVDPRWTAVVRLDPTLSATTSARCDTADPNQGVMVGFRVEGDALAQRYRELGNVGLGSSGLPPEFGPTASVVGILEEHRFYVREEREVAGDETTALVPRLSQARLYPNTNRAWRDDDANLAIDLADGIFDLQVSLALDTAQGSSIGAGDVTGDDPMLLETDDGEGDDWLFNSSDDDPETAAVWANTDPRVTDAWRPAQLYAVRINTVGRTARRDLDYEAEPLVRLEDRTYDDATDDDLDSPFQRRFRRQVLTTLVDTRNL